MATLHSTITGADNHEPKGVESATSKTVYVANGAGSGSWVKVAASDVTVSNPNLTSNVEGALEDLRKGYGIVSGQFTDVSNVETVLLPVPFNCKVLSIRMILSGAITVADSTITVTRSDGAAMGTQVIAFAGSAEGTTFDFTPTGNDTFTGHNYIKLVSDGGSTTTAKLYVQALITRS